MSIFKITIKAGKPAVFGPTPLMAHANDSVFWYNGDKVAHWPAPNAANPKAWLPLPDSTRRRVHSNFS